MSDAKYRQRGYQDSGRDKPRSEPRSEHEKAAPRKDTFGPRPVQMPGTHSVSRCSQCGAVLGTLSEPVGQCPKCGFELHSCKQCANFDPSQRFECSQPVPERVPKKDVRNECKFYSISVRVEKQTSTGTAATPGSPNAARMAFDNLFKD